MSNYYLVQNGKRIDAQPGGAFRVDRKQGPFSFHKMKPQEIEAKRSGFKSGFFLYQRGSAGNKKIGKIVSDSNSPFLLVNAGDGPVYNGEERNGNRECLHREMRSPRRNSDEEMKNIEEKKRQKQQKKKKDENEELVHKVQVLALLKKKSVENEDFDEAKGCKLWMERAQRALKELRKLEKYKKAAVKREDYDMAKKLKRQIERLRASALRPERERKEEPKVVIIEETEEKVEMNKPKKVKRVSRRISKNVEKPKEMVKVKKPKKKKGTAKKPTKRTEVKIRKNRSIDHAERQSMRLSLKSKAGAAKKKKLKREKKMEVDDQVVAQPIQYDQTVQKKETWAARAQRLNILDGAFDAYDADNNGSLSVDELAKLFESLGMFLSEIELLEIIEKADTNNDGVVDKEEFLAVMADPQYGCVETWMDTFKRYDVNRNGKISFEEIRMVLEDREQQNISEAELRELWTVADADNDQLGYKEFIELMSKIKYAK